MFKAEGRHFIATLYNVKDIKNLEKLRTVFENGKLLIETTFEDIRHRARIMNLTTSLV